MKGKEDVSQRRQRKLVLDSLVLGVIGAISAQVFTLFMGLSRRNFFMTWIAGYQAPVLPGEKAVLLQEVIGSHGLLLIPVVTTLGGLIAGFIIYGLAPETRGRRNRSRHKVLSYLRRKDTLPRCPLKDLSYRDYPRLGRLRRT